MAYSDYGGFAYRNGDKVDNRSDAVIYEDGSVDGAAGFYPGSVFKNYSISAHVLLGDGPIYVVLYKQSGFTIYCGAHVVNQREVCTGQTFWESLDGHGPPYELNIETHRYQNKPANFKVEGRKIRVYFTGEDNFYMYAAIEEPDGTLWRGFSGYGVGAGFEDQGFEYSTAQRIEKLFQLFPDGGTEDW